MEAASPNSCPVKNECIITAEDALPCGENPHHLPPYTLAEHMCINALAGRARLEAAEVSEELRPARFAERHVALAWHMFEQGMAEPNVAAAMTHFDNSLEHVDAAMYNPYSWFKDTLGAATLHLYRPTLMARKDGLFPGVRDRMVLRQGLAVLYDALMAAPVHVPQSQHILDAIAAEQPHARCLADEGERMGLAAKMVAQMLAARQDIFLYPASEREARTRGDVAQNHDNYALLDGAKIPIKIRMRGKAEKTAGGMRPEGYDTKTQYISIGGLINRTLQGMQSKQKHSYYQLCNARSGMLPNVIDVGQMLSDEITDRPQDKAFSILIESLAVAFEQQLPKDVVSLRRLKRAQQTIAMGGRPAWEILPTNIVRLHKSEQIQDDERSLRVAARAHEQYLRYGSTVPSADELREIISDMRQVKNPDILISCAGVYLDLARSQTSPANAVRLVEASTKLTDTFAAKDWRDVPPDAVHLLYRCRLGRAYTAKYTRALSGEMSDLDDEARLYMTLLDLGRDSLEPGTVLAESDRESLRGVQFEIAMHLLNARFNLKSNKIVQSMWPSLPREDSPHDFSFAYCNGWDAAVTTGGFLQQDATCRYLQLKGVGRGKLYHPSITVIRGKEDLGTVTTADIIIAALQELREDSVTAERAKVALDVYEELFLQKLA